MLRVRRSEKSHSLCMQDYCKGHACEGEPEGKGTGSSNPFVYFELRDSLIPFRDSLLDIVTNEYMEGMRRGGGNKYNLTHFSPASSISRSPKLSLPSPLVY